MLSFKLRALGALVAAGAAAAVALVPPATASTAGNPDSIIYQWYTNGGGRLSGVPFGDCHCDAPGQNGQTAYALSNYIRRSKVNSAVKAEVGAHHQTFGVDIDWGAHGSWQFVRQNFSTTNYAPPTNGEIVALYNSEGGYLVYGHQTFGVDLKWEYQDDPYSPFQWKVNEGDPNHFSLYNTREHDYLIFHHETFGVDLQWLQKTLPSSPQPAGNGATVWLQEQPPVEGYVPYLGYYGGGGTQAVLTGVEDPGPDTVLLVKPGYSTTDCGNASDVIVVGPGQTMTPAEIQAEWGSSQPSLSSRLPFLACVSGSSSLPMVPLNLTYQYTG